MNTTKLTEIAFADQPSECLEEMRSNEDKLPFEKAATVISEWTGRSLEEVRSLGLLRISEYIKENFRDPEGALAWIFQTSKRLGAWCAWNCRDQNVSIRIKAKQKRITTSYQGKEGWTRFDHLQKKVSIPPEPEKEDRKIEPEQLAAIMTASAVISYLMHRSTKESRQQATLRWLADRIMEFPRAPRP